MTIEEIDLTLPNGFHDALLVGIDLSYANRTATLSLSLWIGTMDQPPGELRERQAKATLLLAGLQYCIVEPPVGSPAVDEHDLSTVDGFATHKHLNSSALKLPQLAPEHFAYSFFAYNWNACIHLGYSNALLTFDSMANEQHVRALMGTT